MKSSLHSVILFPQFLLNYSANFQLWRLLILILAAAAAVAEKVKSRSYATINGQSASLSWCQAPIWGLQPDFYYCQDSCVFVDVERSL
jgi:hypothetical protein